MKTKLIRQSVLVLAVCASSACDPESDGIEGVSAPTGFAVTHSDYDSAGAIALLSPEGELEAERFVHSGTVFEGLGAALSSDIVLPTVAGPAGVLTYIERLGTDTVTRIDIAAGQVLGQVQTQAESAGAFRGNPYDVLFDGDDSAWVTRNAPNTTVDADDANAGNDVIAIDLASNEIGTGRISLASMNTTGTVTNMDTGDEMEVTVYARPARMAKVGDRVVVGLDRISLAYDAIGPGMVAVANLATQTASPLAIEGMSNCGGVTPVVDDPSRVIVSCVGSFLAVSRDEAGHAIVRIGGDGAATIEHVWAAAEHANDPELTSGVVSLGGTRIAAVAAGDFATQSDAVYVLDIASGDIAPVGEALAADGAGSYVLGAGAYNAVSKTLLIPDASLDSDGVLMGGVRRFQWGEGDEITELDMVETDADVPPRSVAALR